MNWTCRYCGRPTTLTSPNWDFFWRKIEMASNHFDDKKEKGIHYVAITCPNQSCKRLSLALSLTKVKQDVYGNREQGDDIQKWELLPESTAKPQPAYVPAPIVEDYTEACRIKDLSPKASATLSRRCLQGMIRNFWDIKVEGGKLYDEITELEGKVSASEWEAIDALRSVGNIGAHMKQDVNIVVDVDPGEAGLLIEFIEGLFNDWYVARHDKEARNARLRALAEEKGEKPRKSKSSNGPN